VVPHAAAQNQVEPPDRKFIFFDDIRKEQEKKEAKNHRKNSKRKKSKEKDDTVNFDLTAPEIKFDSTGSSVDAEGGVVISYSNAIIEADSGSFNTKTKDAELKGDVRVSDLSGDLLSDYAQINFDTGAGDLMRSEIYFEEGGYLVQARETIKEPGEAFSFEDVSLTTCDCPDEDDCAPWRLQGSRGRITRDGYGHVQNAVLRAYDVPVMYFPYVIFPAKTERQTGFLRPTFGNSNQNGFMLEMPFYWAIDQSTDATISPIIETKTRYGVRNEFRKIMSEKHNLESGLIYFDESLRNGDLQGTDTTGLNDKNIDTNRVAGYLDYSFDTEVETHPVQILVDGNYVSDDLFLREFDIEEIAPFNTRFVSSTAAVRTPFVLGQQLELSSEFNQAMVDDDDLVFQRLPELNVLGYQTYRPFGQNPYGVKLVHYSNLSAVNFDRKEKYRGSRSEAYESIKVPFFLQNYLEGNIEGETRATYYSVTDNHELAEDGTELDGPSDSSDRFLPGFKSQLSTTVERVFHLESDSLVKQIADLGRSGRVEELSRVKHVVQPIVRYRYVPDVDQSENPQFDSNDLLAKRNVVVYGLKQTLLGRFEPRNEYLFGMEETTPDAEDFEPLGDLGSLDDKFDFGVPAPNQGNFNALRRGSLKQLATLSLSQAYDLDVAKDVNEGADPTEDVDALSDVAAELGLFPNDHFRFRTSTDYDVEDQSFSSYAVDGQVISRRGDELRSRLTFVDTALRQLESGVQLTLSQNMKLGYYSRYDDFEGKFIESRVGLRLNSSCKCWVLDLEWSDQINPDETKALVNITLLGLGEVGNEFFNEDKTRPPS